METITQAAQAVARQVKKQASQMAETAYVITGVDQDGEFTTWQTGINRLKTVQELQKYHRPFKLVSIHEI